MVDLGLRKTFAEELAMTIARKVLVNPTVTPLYHCISRCVRRAFLCGEENSHRKEWIEDRLQELVNYFAIDVCGFSIMPNQWHFVVRPSTDSQVSEFFQRLTTTHSMRWHAHYKTGGTGHLYQGRFKSFPVQDDEYLLAVMRYVERNPRRANFVERAEDWTWSSAHARLLPPAERRWLSIPSNPALPKSWRTWVNSPETEAEILALRNCVRRGLPFGDERWVQSSAVRLGLETTIRPRGRPKKQA